MRRKNGDVWFVQWIARDDPSPQGWREVRQRLCHHHVWSRLVESMPSIRVRLVNDRIHIEEMEGGMVLKQIKCTIAQFKQDVVGEGIKQIARGRKRCN